MGRHSPARRSSVCVDIPAGDDVDYYRFKADAGTSLIAEVANGQLDSLIGLFDNAGNLYVGAMLYDDDPKKWIYPQKVADTLKWEKKQLQLRKPTN